MKTRLDIRLTRFELNDARIRFTDQVNGTSVFIPDLDMNASGNYKGDQLLLQTNTEAAALYFGTGGIDYAENMNVRSNLDLDIDLEKATYDIIEGIFNINGLSLSLEGKMGVEENGMRMKLSFDAPENDFSDLWSVLPAYLKTDMGDITTTGLFAIDGHIAGLYDTETGQLPGIDIKFNTENAPG